jgi:hypothetical protein
MFLSPANHDNSESLWAAADYVPRLAKTKEKRFNT